MVKREVTLAAACMQVEHDKSKNLDKYVGFIDEAFSKGADFLAFPEASLQGYTWAFDRQKQCFIDDPEQREYFLQESEPIPSPSTDLVQSYCKKYDMYIQIGMAERADVRGKTKLYNSAVIIGPNGIIGIHRKVYMAPNAVFSIGDRFSVFETELGKFGALVCMDIIAPESVRTLAVQGAQVVMFSTAWSAREYRGYQYNILTRANALMNQIWLVCADQVGLSSKQKALGQKVGCFGHSSIIAPTGKIISEVGYEEGLAIATVDIKGGIDEARSPTFHGHNYLELLRTHAECHIPLFEIKTH